MERMTQAQYTKSTVVSAKKHLDNNNNKTNKQT